MATQCRAEPNLPNPSGFGEILRRRRVELPLTLQELSEKSSISSSHLGRIERGERCPSARVLKKLACHLKFEENELFILAGFLTPNGDNHRSNPGDSVYPTRLDPYVARVLAEETPEVQRSVVGLLAVFKNVARSLVNEKKASP